MKDLIIRELEGERSVVYGLDWAPLIGAKLERQSLAHARRVKATHHVPAVEHSSSVGAAWLPTDKKAGKHRALYSAGAIVALKHPTSAYLGIIQIEEDLVWVIATHNGSVIKGTDTLCSPEEAEALVESVRKRYPNISDLEDTDVQSYLNDRTQLKAVRYGLDAIPTPLKVAGIAALVLLVGNLGWEQATRIIHSYTRSSATTVQVDAEQEWREALETWAGQTLVDGPEGFSTIFAAVMDLPPTVGGWALSAGSDSTKFPALKCTAVQRVWTCYAHYTRGHTATNQSFLAQRRPEWNVQWNDLDNVTVDWKVKAQRHPLARGRIPLLTDFSIEDVSRLQDVSKAFVLIDIKPPIKVSVPAPVVNDSAGNRVPLDLPEKMLLPSSMSLEIHGPLRSLAAFPLNHATRINQLIFQVNRNEARPDLRTSAIYGQIKGEYYVQ